MRVREGGGGRFYTWMRLGFRRGFCLLSIHRGQWSTTQLLKIPRTRRPMLHQKSPKRGCLMMTDLGPVSIGMNSSGLKLRSRSCHIWQVRLVCSVIYGKSDCVLPLTALSASSQIGTYIYQGPSKHQMPRSCKYPRPGTIRTSFLLWPSCCWLCIGGGF